MDENYTLLRKGVRDIGVIAHYAEGVTESALGPIDAALVDEICWIADDLERVALEMRAIAKRLADKPARQSRKRRQRRAQPANGAQAQGETALESGGSGAPSDGVGEYHAPPTDLTDAAEPTEPIQRRRRQP
jgi:hypothetical protein